MFAKNDSFVMNEMLLFCYAVYSVLFIRLWETISK